MNTTNVNAEQTVCVLLDDDTLQKAATVLSKTVAALSLLGLYATDIDVSLYDRNMSTIDFLREITDISNVHAQCILDIAKCRRQLAEQSKATATDSRQLPLPL